MVLRILNFENINNNFFEFFKSLYLDVGDKVLEKFYFFVDNKQDLGGVNGKGDILYQCVDVYEGDLESFVLNVEVVDIKINRKVDGIVSFEVDIS